MNVMPALPPAVLSSWANPTICTVVWVPSASVTDFTWCAVELPLGRAQLYLLRHLDGSRLVAGCTDLGRNLRELVPRIGLHRRLHRDAGSSLGAAGRRRTLVSIGALAVGRVRACASSAPWLAAGTSTASLGCTPASPNQFVANPATSTTTTTTAAATAPIFAPVLLECRRPADGAPAAPCALPAWAAPAAWAPTGAPHFPQKAAPPQSHFRT